MTNQLKRSTIGLAGATQVAVLVAMVLGGCGVRLDLLGDAGVRGDGSSLDAQWDGFIFPDTATYHCFAPDGAAFEASSLCPDTAPDCQRTVVGARCQVTGSIECAGGDPCPSSWAAAQLPSSCTGTDGIVLGACGDANAWFRPVAGLTCAYDVATGTLVGVRRRGDLPQDYCPGAKTPQDEEVTGRVPDPCVVAANPITFSCQPMPDAATDTPPP